ncbi:MAG: phenylalanyl-tRNA synthetase subunit beta [Rhodobacteraceae bacterium]|nr:MAG: phenylalanyl-tRNA synthetase subunit beta [Paracoccaceae bacterium]
MIRTRVAVILLLGLIVLAHVALWRSDRMETGMKLTLTLINAVGWAVVLIPAWAVSKWLNAHRHKD